MKIARATKEDIDAAAGLVSVLNTVDDGYYPTKDFDNPGDPTHKVTRRASARSLLTAVLERND